MMVSAYINDFQKVTRKYGDMFDFYYFPNKDDANKFFNADQLPHGVMNYLIIDPNEKTYLKPFPSSNSLDSDSV